MRLKGTAYPYTYATDKYESLARRAIFFCLLGIYRKERPDYIFHFTIKPNIYGTLAARLLGIHSTVMVAGLGFTFSHGGWASKMARVCCFGLPWDSLIRLWC